MKISILGAPGSGKTWLANALIKSFAGTATTPPPSLDIRESTTAVAVAAQQFDLILLMGLDLARATGEDIPGLQDMRETQDAQLRADLTRAGAVFHVIYGHGAARLANALAVFKPENAPVLEADYAYSTRVNGQFASKNRHNWQWNCDKCSDPDCEHLLFTSLAESSAKPLPAQE
jgi:50S ribosome-binding GTPase